MAVSIAAPAMRTMKLFTLLSVVLVAVLQMPLVRAGGRGSAECGPNMTNPCTDPTQCCSSKGKCGNTDLYCSAGCQNGPCYSMKAFLPSEIDATEKSTSQLVTPELFARVFPERNSFYSYEAFVAAAKAFPSFGTTGSSTSQKREVAAFFAHVHHETLGLTVVVEPSNVDETADFCCTKYCLESNPSAKSFSCFPGKKYIARGPLKLTWNYNYGQASIDLGVDLLANPEQVTENAVLSFKSALWVWMSPANEKTPSAHEVMAGSWAPSASDVSANRVRGFGSTIAVLAGGAECGKESAGAAARTEKYLDVANMLNVDAGANLACAKMLPF